MTHQEAHQIMQDYFLDHANDMTHRQCTAFLIVLLSMPLLPESTQQFPVEVANDILR